MKIERNLIGKTIAEICTMEKFDVIIIGAGAAGLMAANILACAKKKVCIIEARDRIGGRVRTISNAGFSKPIEAGAEFIHGNLSVTIDLLKKYEIQYHRTEGELWQLKNDDIKRREDFIEHADEIMKKLNELKTDMSIADFLNKYFTDDKYADMKRSLQQYTESYEAADINYFSALALKEEWESEDEEQYRIEGGYGALLEHLKKDCIKNECAIYLKEIVKAIKWKEQYVEVFTKENKTFAADKIIITVPLPLLSDETLDAGISFEPQLPVINEAAKQIGYGGVIKVIIEFDHAFWETGEVRKAENMFFVFSEETIPTWWSQLPDKIPMLTGWMAGPKTKELEHADDDKILQQALRSLCSIFDIHIEILQQYIKSSYVHNWLSDPFSKGAYSYNTTTSAAAKKIFATPVANTLYFAGEAFNASSNATVDAALTSGKNTAEEILKLMK